MTSTRFPARTVILRLADQSAATVIKGVGDLAAVATQESLAGAVAVLTGRPDNDVVTASTAAGRVLISLDVGLGDIRAYPPGSHTGISLCCNAACCASVIPD